MTNLIIDAKKRKITCICPECGNHFPFDNETFDEVTNLATDPKCGRPHYLGVARIRPEGQPLSWGMFRHPDLQTSRGNMSVACRSCQKAFPTYKVSNGQRIKCHHCQAEATVWEAEWLHLIKSGPSISHLGCNACNGDGLLPRCWSCDKIFSKM
ncbi:hypothetical protein CL634_00530 [bacterium]|nr:hypothetical protein [bacterium]